MTTSKTTATTASSCVLLFALLTGCGRPTGADAAGGERTSKGDVAAGVTTDPVPPNREAGAGGTSSALAPLDSAPLLNELKTANYDQRQALLGRVDAAMRTLDGHLRSVRGFGLEVDRPNGEPGLPPPLQRLRDELQTAYSEMRSADASQWASAKQRLAQTWQQLEDEFKRRRPAGV